MTIKMYKEVNEKILKTIGMFAAESGGIIACNSEGAIVDFYFDTEAGSGKISYIPTSYAINHQVNDKWKKNGYRFGGVVHSHPEGAKLKPSKPDIKMAEEIMRHNCLKNIILIIVQNLNLSTWYFTYESKLESCELTLI